MGARDVDAEALENELYGPTRVKPLGLVFDLLEFPFCGATSLCALFRSSGLRTRSSRDLWSGSLSEVQAAKWAIIGFVERSALSLLHFRLGPDLQHDETFIVLVLGLCAARGVRFLLTLDSPPMEAPLRAALVELGVDVKKVSLCCFGSPLCEDCVVASAFQLAAAGSLSCTCAVPRRLRDTDVSADDDDVRRCRDLTPELGALLFESYMVALSSDEKQTVRNGVGTTYWIRELVSSLDFKVWVQ